ncbi:MAG: alanine racemase, partial [Oscillospiraceae bacterium]|nr:alanine racemase [Candidatus Equicaccousia limihippi]
MQGRRTWVEIDLDALAHNFKEINKTLVSGEAVAVVKADAYGHGACVLAPYLEKLGARHFAVSNIEEAQELRRAGVLGDIIILGYTDEALAVELFEDNLIQAVFSFEYAKKLNTVAKRSGVKIKCHLKLDTGMGRIGFCCRNGEQHRRSLEEIKDVLSLSNLYVCGAFTHFAVADSTSEGDLAFTKEQLTCFDKMCADVEEYLGRRIVKHCCNSAATVLQPSYQRDINRVGIILYGLLPDASLTLPIKLKPLMSFKTVISEIKEIEAGESVSYGRTYAAKERVKVATVPVGYADRLRRSLSGVGEMSVGGKKAKIIGRICMDQCMLDVTGIDCKEGDTVTIFGKEQPIDTVAKWCDTINYEICCNISRRVPRLYFKG